jgi:hypothetical protein
MGRGNDGEPPMVSAQELETQTKFALTMEDVRTAAAAYEMVREANRMLARLPIPVLLALRDYANERIKCRTGLLCERHYVEHLDYLIKETRARERRLLYGINGIVPPEPDGGDDASR